MQRLIIRCYYTGRQSYYDILGLSKTATAAEIKKAFYTLSKKYHPDLTGSNEAATKKFVAVKEAYDTLRDPNKRKGYDNQMAGGFSSSSYGYPNQKYQSNTYQRDEFNWKKSEFERRQKEWNREQRRAEDEARKSAEKDEFNKKIDRFLISSVFVLVLISSLSPFIFQRKKRY